MAELRVLRAGGSFGSVTVPYEVIIIGPAGAELTDLSPVRGALSFQPQELFQVCMHVCGIILIGMSEASFILGI